MTAVGCVIIVRGTLVVRGMRRGMHCAMHHAMHHAMYHAAGERRPGPNSNQVSGILVVLICGSKETAVVPITYMVERWSQWEFLYYAIPMGLFTLLCNGAPLYSGSQELYPALTSAHTFALGLIPTLAQLYTLALASTSPSPPPLPVTLYYYDGKLVKASQAAREASKQESEGQRRRASEGESSVEAGGRPAEARAAAAAVEGATEMELAAEVLSQFEYRRIRVLYPVAASTLAGWSVLRSRGIEAQHAHTLCTPRAHRVHTTCTPGPHAHQVGAAQQEHRRARLRRAGLPLGGRAHAHQLRHLPHRLRHARRHTAADRLGEQRPHVL